LCASVLGGIAKRRLKMPNTDLRLNL